MGRIPRPSSARVVIARVARHWLCGFGPLRIGHSAVSDAANRPVCGFPGFTLWNNPKDLRWPTQWRVVCCGACTPPRPACRICGFLTTQVPMGIELFKDERGISAPSDEHCYGFPIEPPQPPLLGDR